jgi:hexosaminidase
MQKLIGTAFLLIAMFSAAQTQFHINVMPMPSSVQLGTGTLPIRQSFTVAVTGFHDAVLDRGVERFSSQLSRQTGMRWPHKPADMAATLEVHADHGSDPVIRLGEDESYELVVNNSGAKLSAPNPLGILHGLQTFLQLVGVSGDGFAVPAVTIKDRPRFAWRGTLIDVSRHFIPLDVLKRNLDGMAAVKLNVLHWHLSDNEGFRVESKKLPKLHEMGSDGLYYTQDEIREFISYARDRGIRVLPEFDMPGHSRSWLIGYPELASGAGPYLLEPGGPEPVIDPTPEATYKFLDKFVDEMARLFPDAYFHIGGDEVDPGPWNANPKIQAFMQAHAMKTPQDLQAYFNQRLEKIVSKHHKIMVGWDEVLHPDLPKNIVVQSWRGQKSLAVAARQGYTGLLSAGYYIDLMWPAARHYAVDPLSDDAAALNDDEKKRILGGESCMWAEWVTPENIDSHIWPRNAAVAERLWSPQDVTDVASMYARLRELSGRLEVLGLTHRSAEDRLLRRIAGQDDISALRTFADVVEPGKDYTRGDSLKGPRFNYTPLNRLADVIPPESEVALHFSDLVQTYLQSKGTDHSAETEIRSYLASWRDNDAKMRSLLDQSFLLKDVPPLSADLSALGAAGLQALDYLDKPEPSPEAWRTDQLALAARAKTLRADLLIMVAAPVQRLIEASAGQQ